MTEGIEMDYNVPSPTTEEVEMAKEKMPHEEYRKRQNEFQAKYDKENTVMVTFKLNKKTDPDILDKLAAQPNRQGYIKELIRKDIAEGTRIDSEST